MTGRDDNSGMLVEARRARLLAALKRDGAIRISTIADELGVTPVTVRRDIDQLEREGLLRRVYGGAVAIAEEPSAAGMPDEHGSLGVVVPSLEYFWPGVVRGIEEEARLHGLRLVLRGSSYGPTDERPILEHLARTPGVRGLIVAPNPAGPHRQELFQLLAESGLPHVLVEREGPPPPDGEALESVVSDYGQGTMAAVNHLVELGHRRVGLVCLRSPISPRIEVGWRAACEQLGLASDNRFERVIPDRRSPDYQAAMSALDEVLKEALAAGITALLVHADPEAVAVVQHAQAMGILVPGDLSVVAYDDEIAGLFSPALTAVQPARADIGRAAVDLIVKRLANPRRAVHRTVVSPRLVVRESTAPAES